MQAIFGSRSLREVKQKIIQEIRNILSDEEFSLFQKIVQLESLREDWFEEKEGKIQYVECVSAQGVLYAFLGTGYHSQCLVFLSTRFFSFFMID